MRVPAGSHRHRVEEALVPQTGLSEVVLGPVPQWPAQPRAQGRIEARLGPIKQVAGHVPLQEEAQGLLAHSSADPQ